MAEPISVQQLKDASLDVKSLEEVVNGDESVIVTTRLGETYPSIKSVLENTISNFGFIIVDSFELGATLTQRNQVLRHTADGRLYRWGGSLPKTVAASSTPENTGGFGNNAWLEVSDVILAQKLSGLGGASFIKNGVSVFEDLASFNAASSKVQKNTKVYLQKVYQNNDLEGEGRVYSFVTSEVANAVNIATTGGFLTRPYDGKVFVAEFGCKPDDNTLLIYSTNSTALQKAFDLIRYYGGGILSMGNECEYPIGTDDPNGGTKDTIYANVSNLYWLFNNSTIKLRYFRTAWHPTAASYGNHKNINIHDAIFKGDSSVKREDGVGISVMQNDFVHVDYMTVKNCRFIESNGGGHNLDLMGCRYVDVIDSDFLGSSITDRLFAESVQISKVSTSAIGNPLKSGSVGITSELNCQHINYKRNTVKPHYNETSGETTYPARPIGHHGLDINEHITVEDNYIEDVTLQDGYSDSYKQPVLYLAGDHIYVKNNEIVSTNGNNTIIRIDSYNSLLETKGIKNHIEISGNTIKLKGMKALSNHLSVPQTAFIPFYIKCFRGTGQVVDTVGLDLLINENVIEVENISETTKMTSLFFVDTTINNVNMQFDDNDIKTKGLADNILSVSKGGGSASPRNGGLLTIRRNKLEGLLNSLAILVDANTYTSKGKGMPVVVDGNIFINTWRACYIYQYSAVSFTNNKLIGHSPASFSGETTFSGTVSLRGDYNHLSGNVVFNDDRLELVKVNIATLVPESWQVEIVNT